MLLWKFNTARYEKPQLVTAALTQYYGGDKVVAAPFFRQHFGHENGALVSEKVREHTGEVNTEK